MKALFLIFHGFEKYNIGISKKIHYQKEALSHYGLDIRLCYLSIDGSGMNKRMVDNEVLEDYQNGVLAKIKKRVCYSRLFKYILDNNIMFLYIRSSHNANPSLINLLKKLKQVGVKSIMEIPTYPYDQEYKNARLFDRMSLIIDKLYRYKLGRYIYRIVTYSNDQIIFGVPTINISNGIDFSQIRIRSIMNRQENSIRLIGVAEIHFWHGFDRVLNGMAQYYKKNKRIQIFFDIVGDGVPEEIDKLKEMTDSLGLKRYVTFYGSKAGEDLDRLFDQADVGIASLGRHRSNITYIKPLKNREYAARGIPFVYSETDEDFEQMSYVMKASPDESPLDIEKVVKFFYNQNLSPQEIRKSIIHKLSWDVQMKKVIDAVMPH